MSRTFRHTQLPQNTHISIVNEKKPDKDETKISPAKGNSARCLYATHTRKKSPNEVAVSKYRDSYSALGQHSFALMVGRITRAMLMCWLENLHKTKERLLLVDIDSIIYIRLSSLKTLIFRLVEPSRHQRCFHLYWMNKKLLSSRYRTANWTSSNSITATNPSACCFFSGECPSTAHIRWGDGLLFQASVSPTHRKKWIFFFFVSRQSLWVIAGFVARLSLSEKLFSWCTISFTYVVTLMRW